MHPAILASIIVIGSLCLLAILALLLRRFLLAPGKRNAEMERYIGVRYAHRGLHDNVRAENSLSAFAAAKAAGYGIELDVRLCADGDLVVFHDATLNRVCGTDGKVIEKTKKELKELSLCGSTEGVPSLREVLELIDGAVPLLIEVKQDAGESGIAERLVEELRGYRGEYIVESFNPYALRTVRNLRPDILRGILSMDYTHGKTKKVKLLYKLLGSLWFNFMMRPDFIAYEKTGYANKNLRYIRRKFNTPLIAWTVKSEEEEIRVLGDGFDTVIFEDYLSGK